MNVGAFAGKIIGCAFAGGRRCIYADRLFAWRRRTRVCASSLLPLAGCAPCCLRQHHALTFPSYVVLTLLHATFSSSATHSNACSPPSCFYLPAYLPRLHGGMCVQPHLHYSLLLALPLHLLPSGERYWSCVGVPISVRVTPVACSPSSSGAWWRKGAYFARCSAHALPLLLLITVLNGRWAERFALP